MNYEDAGGLCFLAGLICVVVAGWLVSPALGVFVLGVCLLLAAVTCVWTVQARDKTPKEPPQ